MLKKLPGLFFFIFIFQFSVAQPNLNIDSLLNLASKENNDTLKAKHLNALIKAYVWKEKIKEASALLPKVKSLCEKSTLQKRSFAKNYVYLGNYNLGKLNFDLATRYYDTCLELRTALNDIRGMAEALNSKGIIKWKTANYNSALALYMDALKKSEGIKDSMLCNRILNNIGIIYFNLDRFDLSINYYKKVLEYTDSVKNPSLYATALGNLALSCLAFKKTDDALNYHLRSLKISERLKDKSATASSYLNIGNVYHEKKDLHNALVYFQKSKQTNEEIGDSASLPYCYGNIGSVYAQQGNYSLAKQYQLKGFMIAEKLNLRELMKDISKRLAESCYEMKNYKEAYDYFKKYSQINDSIFNSESSQQVAEMETKYQSEKKEQENTLLKQQNDIHVLEAEKKNADLKRQRTTITLVSFGLILMLVLAIFIFRGYREKQKANKIISEQKHIVEEKQKEILDSIRYAKRIQTALMANEKYIGKSIERLKKN